MGMTVSNLVAKALVMIFRSVLIRESGWWLGGILIGFQ